MSHNLNYFKEWIKGWYCINTEGLGNVRQVSQKLKLSGNLILTSIVQYSKIQELYIFLDFIFLERESLKSLKDFIYLFLERGRKGEKDTSTGCLLHTPTGDPAHSPGLCPG